MTKKNIQTKSTTDEQVELYGIISPLLKSMYSEIKDFSKKRLDDPMNLNKVRMINRLLVKAKEVLKNEASNEYLDLLEEDDLPSISDAVLIVSLYISALDKFHSDHYHYDSDLGFGWDNSGHWQ